jgi:hypothetical protein
LAPARRPRGPAVAAHAADDSDVVDVLDPGRVTAGAFAATAMAANGTPRDG